MNGEVRPDPDVLLRRLGTEASKRGRLKVFFGASAGVGKTYAMLEAAQKKRAAGVDVVIGWIETHGRSETVALTHGLPTLAPREIDYRGTRLRELDLDAALERRPALLLLDELAHTNLPGSRHAKRWQDVAELRDAGIDVYTTLNVQHIESLNDLVSRVTGVVIRETIPDRAFDDADEVELVDLPPEDLQQRLADGKVYLPERASAAAQSFFRKGNLIALRELALRRTADRVDAQMQDYRRDHEIAQTWPVAERVLVCVRPNPDSGRLVRAARRLAAGLRAEWIVAYVESPTQPPLSAADRQVLAATVKLAEQLGAETAVISGERVGQALVAFARERNVSKIVVGKPAHARWRDRLRGSLVDELVRASGDVDVYIISGDGNGERIERQAPRARRTASAWDYAWSGVAVALCSAVCWAMFGNFDKSNLIMVYLLGVAYAATRHGQGPSVFAACLSVAAFDFLFVPPYLTFAVTDTQYVVTFAVMLIVGLLISTLAVRVRGQAESSRQRERRTQLLYALSRDLARLRAPDEIARAASGQVAEVFHGPAAVLLPGIAGQLAWSADETGLASDPRETAVAQWAFDHSQMAGLGTDTLPGASALYAPLPGAQGAVGILALRPDAALRPLSPDQVDLLDTIARQVAAALERARLSAEIERARVTTEGERLRSALLSSVSHDLRTPLGVIEGAASTLLDESATLDDAARRDLTETIHEEIQHLNRRVRNLLDMTRLEAGQVQLDVEWQSLEEIVGAALERLELRLAGRNVAVDLPEDLPLLPCDAVLLEQVFVNLFENALKYSPAGSPIEVSAEADADAVAVTIGDRGKGLPLGEETRVFEKFHRAPRDRGASGVGLGLAICRAIVVAHGGRIWAENRAGGGAAFRLSLPRGEAPPSPPPEAAA